MSTADAASDPATFDEYADDYDEALARGLQLSGETSEYFARARVAWLGRRLDAHGVVPTTILDYGCGTGSTIPLLLELPGARRVVATDESSGLLERARTANPGGDVRVVDMHEQLDEPVDVAYCNGVFHHIEPSGRGAAVDYVLRALRPGGLFAFWENNPWNPGTRMVMRRVPFDRDAIMVSSRGARRMLREGGFEIAGTEFAFVFPNALRRLRVLEPHLARVPIGGQYLVLARRPMTT